MLDAMTTEMRTFNDVDWKRQEEDDDALMSKLLSDSQQNGDQPLFDANRPLDAGEKADDAQDFEDISDDDDLPDEEEATGGHDGDVPGLTDDMGTSHDTDDLFGDDRGSSPFDEHMDHDGFPYDGTSQPVRINGGLSFPSQEEPEIDLRELNFPEHHAAANQDPSIPAIAESAEDLVKQMWPSFEQGITLNWNDLLPPKKAHFIPKVPEKTPKVVNPTKVSLDLAPDQEKSFRTAGPATSDKRKQILEAEAKGLVAIVEDSSDDESSDDGFDYSPVDPDEKIGGVDWTDLQIICADWEANINPQLLEPQVEEFEDEPMDEWEREILGSKRKKAASYVETDFINAPRFPIPNFDNFEQMAAHIAKRVVIDLNDPHLLVDVQEFNPAAKRRRIGPGGNYKRVGNGSLSSILKQRFNYSNDEAYDALKENHQSKVRATLGNLPVEHSMPALKLQWPYYRVKLYTKDARSFHRPSLKFNKLVGQPIQFTKPGMRKKKEIKKLGSTDKIFAKTKDLTLADHYSTATLLEYSEEHPTVLSNFGMGNRIINYYRRKDADDTERPNPEDKIGDVTVLLPEDRSPFSNFGMVDPGETVRTLHNAMYRVPIFKHEPKNTDFLVIRSSTGIEGINWHIRNIDNLFVVGQQFPSVEIPGPHSRKVTNAAKNRMKMIAFRKIDKSKEKHLKIGEITAHIADSSDMQNRQKLKEFIHYDKIAKVWRMKPGDQIPDAETIRSMVKPEEVCVIDAMQVGSRHLEDAGYAAEDDDDDNEEREGRSLEQDLAPWKTSKAFLEASADKAMLQLHGEGDPSGCGLAFSFIKTSMKGGYIGAVQGPSATSAAQIEKERKQNGGHTYNVKKQQNLYNEAIREIWEKQKANLSDPTERAENELEREQAEEEEKAGVAQTPRSMATPAVFDDTASQFSVGSRQGRAMRITRKFRNKFGKIEETTEIVKDVRVWREYQKRRHAIDAEKTNVYEAKPTGNADFDRQEAARIKKELARLERNKDRRHAREKQKGIFRGSTEREMTAASPSATPAPSVEKPTGTTRKCANCGQAGHIKTNKKLCPMLNGTMKPEDSAANHGGFGAINAPSFP